MIALVLICLVACLIEVAQTVKCLPTMWETRFDPWVGKIPWRRKWQPTPVLLPGKSHGWRILVGYSPWGCKESDITEQLHFTCLIDQASRNQLTDSGLVHDTSSSLVNV